MQIKLGSTGDDVLRIQENLGLKKDGDFGSITERTIKSWQNNNGFTSNGIIDDIQYNKMFNSLTNDVLLKLKNHIPDFILKELPDLSDNFFINTPLRLSHFLSQCSHESDNFRITEENLNYSSKRLKVVFPKYFPDNLSDEYANNPKKIGSRVYGNRLGNGDEKSGEGYIYRGRGYIQITGKENYKNFGSFVQDDLVAFPDKMATEYALISAGWFFYRKKLFVEADKGSSIENITNITRLVNGGSNGLQERIDYFNKYYKILK